MFRDRTAIQDSPFVYKLYIDYCAIFHPACPFRPAKSVVLEQRVNP